VKFRVLNEDHFTVPCFSTVNYYYVTSVVGFESEMSVKQANTVLYASTRDTWLNSFVVGESEETEILYLKKLNNYK
jgi:hypothetical protein